MDLLQPHLGGMEIISFDCRSSYTLVGKAKNIFLISMDSGCGDENPFLDTKPELNLIEVSSRFLKKRFGESIKSTWFTDSRTTLQGKFWRHNITIDRKVEIHRDIERVETSKMCAIDFKSISLNNVVALSFISRLIRQLTMGDRLLVVANVAPRQPRTT